jgi:hypothetical protein
MLPLFCLSFAPPNPSAILQLSRARWLSRDYHCHHLYVWNDKTRTRWRGKTCSDSVQSCAASLYPFLFIRISAVREYSPFSVIRARYLNGFVGKKSFFENLILSQFIQQHFAFYKARKLIQVVTRACLGCLSRGSYFSLSFNTIPILSLLVYDAVHFGEYVATFLRNLLPLFSRLKSIWWRVSILDRVLKSVWHTVLLEM